MGECCRWGWLVRQGDTPDDAKLKTILFPFTLFMFVVYMFLIVNQIQTSIIMLNVIGYAILTFSALQFMVGVVSNVIPVRYLFDVILVLSTVGICLQDLGTATTSYPMRPWAFVVLVLDGALVFNRYHIPRFIIPFVLVYQAALQVESVSRFG
eukprot:Hpha_TRINITY_DN15670_c3_g13::TRINITY_DN15670_c3_g13_i1::g.100619::m.100619